MCCKHCYRIWTWQYLWSFSFNWNQILECNRIHRGPCGTKGRQLLSRPTGTSRFIISWLQLMLLLSLKLSNSKIAVLKYHTQIRYFQNAGLWFPITIGPNRTKISEEKKQLYIYMYVCVSVCVCACVCSYVCCRGCKIGRWFFVCN